MKASIYRYEKAQNRAAWRAERRRAAAPANRGALVVTLALVGLMLIAVLGPVLV